MVWWPNRAVYVLVGVDFTAAKHVLGAVHRQGRRARQVFGWTCSPELR